MKLITRLVLVAVLAGVLAIGSGTAGAAEPESASVGMPFDGRWANSFGTTPDVHPTGGDWAMDVFATGADVNAEFRDVTGTLGLQVTNVSDAGCANAGSRVLVEVTVDGRVLGTVSYMHLVDVTVAPGQLLANGARLGRTVTAAENFPNGTCWRVNFPDLGVHTHMEVRNTAGFSCYVRHDVGGQIARGAAIGRMGDGTGSARRSECGSSSSPAAPAPGLLSASTGYTGSEHPDLLRAVDRLDMTPDKIQEFGVAAIRFINGISGIDDPVDVTGIPTSGQYTYATNWTGSGEARAALDWVMRGYDIDAAEAQKFGATLMVYLSGLNG